MNKDEQRVRLREKLLDNTERRILVFESDLTDQEIYNFINGTDLYVYHQHEHVSMMGKSVSESLFHSLIRLLHTKESLSLQKDWLTKYDEQSRQYILGQCLDNIINYLTFEKKLVIHLLEKDCKSLSNEELKLYCSQFLANPNLTIFTLSHQCEYFKDNQCFSILNLRHNMSAEIPTVYISYKHYDNCKDLAKKEKYTGCLNNILNGLEGIHIPYSIDSQNIKYKDSIKLFEEEIGEGLIVIAIITPEYLKSVGCMYELAQVFENGNINDRLFPVVDIDRSLDFQKEVIAFWNKQITELKDSSAKLPYTDSFSTEIAKVELILKHMGSIWKYLCDRNADSMEGMTENNAEKLMAEISGINSTVSTSKEEKPIMNSRDITQYKEDTPDMSILQNGAHSIGVVNGNVTINFGHS